MGGEWHVGISATYRYPRFSTVIGKKTYSRPENAGIRLPCEGFYFMFWLFRCIQARARFTAWSRSLSGVLFHSLNPNFSSENLCRSAPAKSDCKTTFLRRCWLDGSPQDLASRVCWIGRPQQSFGRAVVDEVSENHKRLIRCSSTELSSPVIISSDMYRPA